MVYGVRSVGYIKTLQKEEVDGVPLSRDLGFYLL